MDCRVCLLSFEYPPAVGGGLGTLITNLEQGLIREGVDVSVFRPAHTTPSELEGHAVADSFTLDYGRESEEILVHNLVGKSGKKNIFLFSSKNPDSKFNDKRIYWWKGIKTSIFSRCFLEYFRRHLDDGKTIIHAHDWHSGLAGCVIKEAYPKTPFLYTIHLVHEGPLSGRKMKEGLFSEYGISKLLSVRALEKRRSRKNYILHPLIPRRTWDKILGTGNFWLEPFIIDHADRVNTVSHGFLKENIIPNFRPFKIDEEKLTYVFNGMHVQDMLLTDLSRKTSARKRVLSDVGLDKGPLFLNLGRQNTGQKGTDVLVKAIDDALESGRIDDARFIIIAGERNIEPRVNKILAKLEEKYHKNVHVFTGWFDDVADYYVAADSFLIPSRYEPFGLTQIEAMTRGAVVIGSWTGGIRNVQVDYEGFVDEEYNGVFGRPTGMLCRTGDARSLTTRIIDMYELIKNKPEEYKLLQKNAIERAKYFTIERTVKGYLKLYEEVINKNSGEK